MRMIDAFKSAVFQNYAQFQGRTHRAEYWWYVLAVTILSFVVAFCGIVVINLFRKGIGDASGIVFYGFFALVAIALFIPNLAIQVRRLHDINLSGWWVLITLIPYIGSIVLLIFMVLPSKPEGKRFGLYVGSDVTERQQ